jgi:hypothetical protein
MEDHTPISPSVTTSPRTHTMTNKTATMTSYNSAPPDIAAESITAKSMATERNHKRLNDAITTNTTLLGTYPRKRITLHDCLPPHNYLPQQPLEPNPELLAHIQTIRTTPISPLQPSPFKFEMSTEAANFNTNILQRHNYDIHKIITSTHTNCTPGIEFRNPELLHSLFHRHALWPFTKQVLLHGAELTLDHEPDDHQRLEENTALIAFNNHQKAKLLPDIINESISTDVTYGFAAPFNIDAINKIPGSMVCPLGVAQQTTLAADGTRIAKNRLTHDQTFSVLYNSESVNDILDFWTNDVRYKLHG